MELEQALYEELSSSTALRDLVTYRIYQHMAPQNTRYPLVICQKVAEGFHHVMGTDPNIREPLVQVSSWSTSFSNCKTVAARIKTILRDYTGTMGSSNLNVQRIFLEGEVNFSMVESETKRTYYHIAQDYRIWYST